MYGADAFGSISYGSTSAEPFDYEAMLASSREELVYTVELTVWEIGGSVETKLYLATAEWATEPDDYPASQPFDGRLTTVLNFTRSIVDQSRLGINHTASDATIAFLNTDGAYDDTIDDFTIDGREVIVRVGRKSDSFADHLIIFRGVGVDWEGEDTVTITVRDKGYLLDVPAQPNTYLGTGGAEGGSDLTGKRKPLVLGGVLTAEPVLLDAANLIYQVHDGEIYDVSVIDRGTPLGFGGSTPTTYAALVSESVTAGQYESATEAGMFKLGANADGILLANASLFTDTFDDQNTTTAVIQYILDRLDVLGEDEIDTASLDALTVALGGGASGVGRYIGPGDTLSVTDLLNDFMAAVGGWAGFNRRGALAFGIFTAPAGDPVVYFGRDEGDIIDLRRGKLPSGVWPPPWRWRVAWAHRYIAFTDFAATVGASSKASFAQPYQLVAAEDASIRDDYLGAQDAPPVEARFRNNADAQAEADRLLALYSAGYRLYRMTLGRAALTLEIGDEINVTWPRYGLDAGKNLVIVEISDRIDLSDGSGVEKVEITAFG